MEGQASIRVLPLGGPWETLGVDRYAGVTAEGIEASASPWGSDSLTFQLKTQQGAERPDMLPFTPVELEVDGVKCWSGRVARKPSDDRAHSVQCEGWQYHLDDDVFERAYVHTRMSDYIDIRSHLSAQLGAAEYFAAGSLNNSGGIYLGVAKGEVVTANARVGVILDLGPDSTAKRVVVTWESSNNQANATLFCRGQNVGPFGSGDAGLTEDFFTVANNSGASGTTAGTVTTTRRYVLLFMYSSPGYTAAADIFFRITSIKVFRATAYESGNASILKADTVVKDARAIATLLDQTDDRVTAGTFSIPEYVTSGLQTPRDVMQAVNLYENYQVYVDVDAKLVYRVKPTAPLFEVGSWSGAEFADSSVSGDDIYNRVVVEAAGPDGAPLIASRTPANLTPVPSTLPDRRGFTRTKVLPIRSSVTTAVAQRFGDLWLAEHVRAPFTGKLSASHGIRRIPGGEAVPPHAMLLFPGELIRLSHRIDPDTGAVGRDGRIANVTYRHDTRTAEIAVDDRRDNFEAVLARYGVLVDQIS